MAEAGRPSKLTPEVQEKLVQALGIGNTRTQAAAYAGIDSSTLWRWMARGRTEEDGLHAELRRAVFDSVRTFYGINPVSGRGRSELAIIFGWSMPTAFLARLHRQVTPTGYTGEPRP